MTTITNDVQHLRDNLISRPGTLLLLAGVGVDQLAIDLADAWDSPAVSVGRRAAEMAARGDSLSPAELMHHGEVFTDLDVLFWAPAFHAEVLTLMRQTARRRPAAFVWPGAIESGVARYSEPGRRDFYESPLADAMVLRPKPDAYAYELPYTLEIVES